MTTPRVDQSTRPVPQSIVDFLQIELRALNQSHELPWIVDHLAYELKRLPLCSDDELSCTGQDLAEMIVQRRRNGEPLAYILGSWPFLDGEFFVGPGVLIPRPETEELAAIVIERELKRIQKTMSDLLSGLRSMRIADFGAGSGCLGIGIARGLLKSAPKLQIELTCIEKSSDALPWLRRNVDKWETDRLKVSIVRGSWLDLNVSAPFDLIVSNPPYVPASQWHESVENSVRDFEPRSSLVPGDVSAKSDASGPYFEIMGRFKEWLQGTFAFELCESQRDFFERQRAQHRFELLNDMSGHLRFAIGSTFEAASDRS
jgi:HemK-like putative methylase